MQGSDGPLSLDLADWNIGDPIPGNVPVTPFINTPGLMQLRNDQNVPVLVMLSEFGLSDYGTGTARTLHQQPDSAHIRIWEFVGATHIDAGFLKDASADEAKTYGSSTVDPCEGPPGIAAVGPPFHAFAA